MQKTMAAFALAVMAAVFAFSGSASEAKSAWSITFGGPVYGGYAPPPAYVYGPPSCGYPVPRRVVYGSPCYGPAYYGPAYGGFSFSYGKW